MAKVVLFLITILTKKKAILVSKHAALALHGRRLCCDCAATLPLELKRKLFPKLSSISQRLGNNNNCVSLLLSTQTERSVFFHGKGSLLLVWLLFYPSVQPNRSVKLRQSRLGALTHQIGCLSWRSSKLPKRILINFSKNKKKPFQVHQTRWSWTAFHEMKNDFHRTTPKNNYDNLDAQPVAVIYGSWTTNDVDSRTAPRKYVNVSMMAIVFR